MSINIYMLQPFSCMCGIWFFSHTHTGININVHMLSSWSAEPLTDEHFILSPCLHVLCLRTWKPEFQSFTLNSAILSRISSNCLVFENLSFTKLCTTVLCLAFHTTPIYAHQQFSPWKLMQVDLPSYMIWLHKPTLSISMKFKRTWWRRQGFMSLFPQLLMCSIGLASPPKRLLDMQLNEMSLWG